MERMTWMTGAAMLVLGMAASPAAAGPGHWGMHGDMHGGMHGDMHGGMHGDMRGFADLNDDGYVSRAEVEAMQAVKFLRWDYDGDGVLTEQEMIDHELARIKRRIAKRFAKIDTNGDGRVERAEFDAGAAERFSQLDADGDGRLDEAEMPRRGHGWRRGHHDHEGGGMDMHQPDGSPFVPGSD